MSRKLRCFRGCTAREQRENLEAQLATEDAAPFASVAAAVVASALVAVFSIVAAAAFEIEQILGSEVKCKDSFFVPPFNSNCFLTADA